MGIIVKFDLEMVQMDAINTFVNYTLDKVIYMRQSLGFETRGNMVLQLRKILYGLRWSFLLW